MKKALWALAMVAGAVMSGSATAGSYQPVYYSGNYVGAVTAPGSTTVMQHAIPMTGLPGPYQVIYDAANGIYGPLRAAWEAKVGASLRAIDGYRSHRSQVNGPLRFIYSGSAPSRVGIVAPSLSVSAKFGKEYLGGLLSGECDVTYSTGAISVAADDFVTETGVLLNPRISLQASRSVSCDTNLWWMPGLNSLLERWAENKIDGMLAEGESALLTKVQRQLPQNVFFGFPSIPAGKYVFNNVDYGAYITNNLPYLVKNSGVELFIEDPNLIAPRQYGIVSSVRASLTFRGPSAGLSFAFREDKKYTRQWVCVPGERCLEP